MTDSATPLFRDIQQGNFRALARGISYIENEVTDFFTQLKDHPPFPGTIIGVTGPPGAGKSTLVDALIGEFIQTKKKVAVLCVDPSSFFHSGALLGDRIRMSEWYNHPGVFIRSLSSRGTLGGLHPGILNIAELLKAGGFDHILIETVGVGQNEIDIASLADVTLVVLMPEAGDEIQAMKAGLMEIGDIFVVNKADMPGAEGAARTVENALAAAYMGEPGINISEARPAAVARPPSLSPGLAALRRRHGDITADASAWVPPVVQVTATENRRVDELAVMIDKFVAWSEQTGRRAERGRERAYAQIMRELTTRLLAPYLRAPGADRWPATVSAWVEKIAEGKASPVEAAQALVPEVEK